MMRREPPRLATWMLEHWTASDRDDALAGDLLEVFRMGRTNGWYWRQVLVACVESWAASLRARVPLLVFALMWSMAAPAWMLFMNRVGSRLTDGWLWRLSGSTGPLAALIGLAVWTVLNSSFLWAAIVVYGVTLRSFGQVIDRRILRRATWMAPLIFLPSMGATFVLMALYSYPGIKASRFAATPLGQIADLRMAADVLRIPYVLTLLCVLWEAVPRSLRAHQRMKDESSIDDSLRAESSDAAAEPDPSALRWFLGWMVAAGLTNAMIIACVLCRPPNVQTPTMTSLLMRAIFYVAVGGLAGAGGAWLYWRNPASLFRNRAPIPFRLFALICACGWVWVPSMVMFYRQVSGASALVAMVGAFLLVSGLREATFLTFDGDQMRGAIPLASSSEIFAESLYRSPVEWHGYLIAGLLYAAGAALLTQSNYIAAVLLAVAAAVFAWKKTATLRPQVEGGDEYNRAARRLVDVAILAVLVTLWALLNGVSHRNRSADGEAAYAASNGAATHGKTKTGTQASAMGFDGYESLILWPYPEKKQILPPIPIESALLTPGIRRPLILPFNGAYRYTQPPRKVPGPGAHRAHATPLKVDIQSSDSMPIMMDAHQILSVPIRVAQCREIDVEIANGDNRAGVISLGVLLTDESGLQKRVLDLGQQPIVSTELSEFSIKSAPVTETLRFAVHQNASLRKFDAITVVVLPDIEHEFITPKIAIQEFQLFGR